MTSMDWFLVAVQGLWSSPSSSSGCARAGSGSGSGAASGRSSSSSSSGSNRRTAHQRDAHHHRGHLGSGGDAGRRRHRLHGPDRELGAPGTTEGAQLRRALVSYVLTILTGTGNTFFSIIPVINEVAYANKIRPERALAGSSVASALGITSSPVAAATATLLPLVEVYGYDLIDVLLITIPASIIGILPMAFVMSRHGKDLDDDVEYQRRLAAGEVSPPAPPAEIVLSQFAKRSVAIFLAGVAAICVFGLFEGLRPTVAAEGGGVEPMSITPLIQMFMLSAAALILLLCRTKANDVASSPIFRSGMVAMIALFGIAWMADTFIANNEDAIVELLGAMAENFPFMIAVAIFAVAALTTSQSAATRTMVPLGLALGIGAGYMIAMWTAVVGVLFLPANGTQIAAAEADTTGTTTLGKRVVDHSFQLPLQVCWIATALAGIVIAWLFFGDTGTTPTPTTPTTP